MKRLSPLVVVVVLLFTLGFGQNVFGDPTPGVPPGDAGETTLALALAARDAVLSISSGVTGLTVDTYSEAVSLLIESSAIRLLTDDIENSLGGNNSKARGAVEQELLLEAINNGTLLDPIWDTAGNDVVTIFPLTWDASPGCITCHSEFTGLPAGQIIGGLITRVKQ